MNPRNNVQRKRRANKRMGRYRLKSIVYDFVDMLRIADTGNFIQDGWVGEEPAPGWTHTMPFRLVE